MKQDVVAYGLSVVGLIWYLALWAIGLVGCFAARRRYRSRPLSSPSRTALNAPGVSILRPLKGLDTNLYENLESTFKQEYPNFEIIFSVADEDDQALLVVHALVERYPRIKTITIIGEQIVGVNPKVNNLIRPFKQATNDLLWVLDSGVMVDAGTLSRSVDVLAGTTPSQSQNKIALIHHVPFALIDEGKIGSHLEAAFLNTNHAKMYIAINTVAVDSCVVGKSNLYRRSDVERVNSSLIPTRSQTVSAQDHVPYGLPAFGRYMAEDNMIASAIWHELGLRHDLSCDVARNVVGNMSFMDYVWRRVRWIRVRKRMVLAATLVEPFTESLVLAIIGGSVCRTLFSLSPWIVIPLHYSLWLYVDLDVYASIAGHTMRREGMFTFLFAWMGREFLALPVYLLAMFGNEVTWRGKNYQILRNGEAELSSCQTSWIPGWFNFFHRSEQYH